MPVHASVIQGAIAAASAVAVEQGLRVVDAVPVGTGSNVIVHLRPAPVVARVMTGTVVLHRDPRAWLTRELEVGAFLADRAPVVAPTRAVDPGPYVRGHLWLSLWEYADVRPTALTAAEIGCGAARPARRAGAVPGHVAAAGGSARRDRLAASRPGGHR